MVEDICMEDIIEVDITTTMDVDTDRVTTITMGTDILMDVVTVHSQVSMDIIETKASIIDIENRLVMEIIDTIQITEIITVTIKTHVIIDITKIQNIETTVTMDMVTITEQQDLQMLDLVLPLYDQDLAILALDLQEDKTHVVLLFGELLTSDPLQHFTYH